MMHEIERYELRLAVSMLRPQDITSEGVVQWATKDGWVEFKDDEGLRKEAYRKRMYTQVTHLSEVPLCTWCGSSDTRTNTVRKHYVEHLGSPVPYTAPILTCLACQRISLTPEAVAARRAARAEAERVGCAPLVKL